jgi:hypothetical protein
MDSSTSLAREHEVRQLVDDDDDLGHSFPILHLHDDFVVAFEVLAFDSRKPGNASSSPRRPTAARRLLFDFRHNGHKSAGNLVDRNSTIFGSIMMNGRPPAFDYTGCSE